MCDDPRQQALTDRERLASECARLAGNHRLNKVLALADALEHRDNRMAAALAELELVRGSALFRRVPGLLQDRVHAACQQLRPAPGRGGKQDDDGDREAIAVATRPVAEFNGSSLHTGPVVVRHAYRLDGGRHEVVATMDDGRQIVTAWSNDRAGILKMVADLNARLGILDGLSDVDATPDEASAALDDVLIRHARDEAADREAAFRAALDAMDAEHDDFEAACDVPRGRRVTA